MGFPCCFNTKDANKNEESYYKSKEKTGDSHQTQSSQPNGFSYTVDWTEQNSYKMAIIYLIVVA